MLMKKAILPGCILLLAPVGLALAGSAGQPQTGVDAGLLTVAYQQFNALFTGEWQQYGQLFTNLQHTLFPRLFLLVITIIPVLFFSHYIAIGSKKFDHTGKRIFYFSLFNRFIHWVAAFSFSLLVITGLLVILSKMFGGGSIIRAGRSLHILSAVVFTISAVPMFLMWLKNMLPALYDIKWFFIMGGYLSKKKNPIPAGKFNAGQKMWFWLATIGGGVMAYTGYSLWNFQGSVDTLRLMAIIHNFLGAALTALFLVHLYMSLFAISGSIRSMISGYKPKEEVDILHSRYKT